MILHYSHKDDVDVDVDAVVAVVAVDDDDDRLAVLHSYSSN